MNFIKNIRNLRVINGAEIYQNGDRVVSKSNEPLAIDEETIWLNINEEEFNTNDGVLNLNADIGLNSLTVNEIEVGNIAADSAVFENLIQPMHFDTNGNLAVGYDNWGIELKDDNKLRVNLGKILYNNPTSPIAMIEIDDLLELLGIDINAFATMMGIPVDKIPDSKFIGFNINDNMFKISTNPLKPSLELQADQTFGNLQINEVVDTWDLIVNNECTIDNLTVSGNTTLGNLSAIDVELSTLNVSGDSTLLNLNVSEALTVLGNTTLSNLSAVDAELSTLLVAEGTTLADATANNLSIIQDLTVDANTELFSLSVFNTATLNGTLEVNGASTLSELSCTAFHMSDDFYYDSVAGHLRANYVVVNQETPLADGELVPLSYLKGLNWLSSTNLGSGLEIATGKLKAKIGEGLKFVSDVIVHDILASAPLSITGKTISLSIGTGLQNLAGALAINLTAGQGITITGSTVATILDPDEITEQLDDLGEITDGLSTTADALTAASTAAAATAAATAAEVVVLQGQTAALGTGAGVLGSALAALQAQINNLQAQILGIGIGAALLGLFGAIAGGGYDEEGNNPDANLEYAINYFYDNITDINSTITGYETNFTTTNLTTTDSTTTNLVSTNSTITNLSSTNSTNTNLVSTNSTITNLTSADITNTNLASTTSTITNLTSTTSTITNLASTTSTITNLASTNSTITNLTSTSATITNLTGSSLSLSGSITAGTWAGSTIPVNKGGTGLSALNTSRIPFGAGTSPFNSTSALNYGVVSTILTFPKASATDTTDSTSKTTGAVVISGGLGCAKNISADSLVITNAITTDSITTYTSTITGNQTVSGNIYMGDTNKGISLSSHWDSTYFDTTLNLPLDGPALFGFVDGSLGTKEGGNKSILYWNKDGKVGINCDADSTLHVKGTGADNCVIKLEATDWETSGDNSVKIIFGNPFSYIRCADDDNFDIVSPGTITLTSDNIVVAGNLNAYSATVETDLNVDGDLIVSGNVSGIISGTIGTLSCTTGTIGTLSCTTGTIGTLSCTTGTITSLTAGSIASPSGNYLNLTNGAGSASVKLLGNTLELSGGITCPSGNYLNITNGAGSASVGLLGNALELNGSWINLDGIVSKNGVETMHIGDVVDWNTWTTLFTMEDGSVYRFYLRTSGEIHVVVAAYNSGGGSHWAYEIGNNLTITYQISGNAFQVNTIYDSKDIYYTYTRFL